MQIHPVVPPNASEPFTLRVSLPGPSTDMSYEDTIDALEKCGCPPRRSGSGHAAHCPLHDDRTPSLMLREGEDGKVLVYCHGPCADMDRGEFARDLFAKLRGEEVDLVVRDEVQREQLRERRHKRPGDIRGQVEARYEYPDPDDAEPDGVNMAWKIRFTVTDGETGEQYRRMEWQNVQGRSLLTLPLFHAAKLREYMAGGNGQPFIVEGESDVLALESLGVVATCPPNGSGNWSPKWTPEFRTAKLVWLYADNDDAGLAHAEKVRAELAAAGIPVRVWKSPHCNDIRAHLEAGHKVNEMVEVAPGSSSSTVDNWPEQIPLVAVRDLPTFPVKALPVWARDMVEAVAEAVHTPSDLPGMAALATMSAAVVGKVTTVVREGTWTELAVLYTLVAANPGERKSSVYRQITQPLYEAESSLIAAHERDQLDNDVEARRLVAKKQAARLIAEMAKDPTAVSLDAVSSALKATDPSLEAPSPRLLCDDITPEGLVSLIGLHQTMAILSPEGGVLLTATGKRYSETAHLDLLLKAYTGELFSVDRKTTGLVRVERPALTIGLTVQPRVLAELAGSREFVQRGLVSRFLIAVPEETVGRRPFEGATILEGISDAWHDKIYNTALKFHSIPHAVVYLTNEAYALLAQFHDEVEPTLASGGRLAETGGWGSKMVGSAVRLATLFHVLDHADDDSWRNMVGPEYVTAAIEIMRYTSAHILAAMDGALASGRLVDARLVWGRLVRDGLPKAITLRDLKRMLPVLLGHSDQERLVPALVLLEECGYLRKRIIQPPQGGRPSVEYEIRG